MPYRFIPAEPIPQAIRRIIAEQIDSAVQELTADGTAGRRDRAVHEGRKSTKKIRGLLRLAESPIGAVRAAENEHFRDLGRKLSDLRDRKALIEVLDDFASKNTSHLPSQITARIRCALLKSKREFERHSSLKGILHQVATAFIKGRDQIEKWELEGDGFKAIKPGLKKTYSRGRKALARTQKNPSPENDHLLRKRVKDHWYHLRLLKDVAPRAMKRVDQLNELETVLGDMHNVAVLRQHVAGSPADFGTPEQIAQFLPAVDAYYQELRKHAIKLSKRIYREKPSQLVSRVKRAWKSA